MNGWATNGQFTPNQQQGHLNPAAIYNSFPTSLDQFTAAGLQNGGAGAGAGAGTPTPSTFNPASVIPAKRTQHDAGLSASPQQQQQQQQMRSQSHTPGFAFPNQQQQGGQPFPNAPTPYQHLQQPPSSNATPSPTMSNNQYRPQPQQQQPRMQNASPGLFPQPGQQQQQGGFSQMSPGAVQQPGQGNGMQQQAQMAGWNQGMNLNPNEINMGGMNATMMSQANQQRLYQMKLQQQQEALRRSGMVPPRPGGGQQNQMSPVAGQQGGQMPNGQVPNAAAISAQHTKKVQFLRSLQHHAQSQGRQFNPNPMVCGRPIDLYILWSVVAPAGGSGNVDRHNQWPVIATKFQLPPNQFPSAAEEIKQIYARDVSSYERAWFNMRSQQKQEQARMHAHQMAGLGGPTPSTPSRPMQPPNQQQYNQFAQNQQGQQQPHATPVQARAQLPQNGMATPQQMMQHRRNSSVRKPEQMTPGGPQPVTAPSPGSAMKVQRSPSVKQEFGNAVMKSEEPQSSEYHPNSHTVESDGGYDMAALHELGSIIARTMPNIPLLDEMGVIDMRAITFSLASGIHSEVRYALDSLVVISRDDRIHFELGHCEDLMDVIVDCAEEQVDLLAEEAAEVSDALDLLSYEDVMRGSRAEADTLQDVPEYGTTAYELNRAADKVIAITTIMRNFSFFEHNHALLTSSPVVKWLSNTLRLLGTRNMLLRTLHNTLDFYKDIIIFLSNITQSLELPTRDDALHVLHFLLAFAPQPAPSFDESGDSGRVRFAPFNPAIHRYLPPAVDCLAKLLARQDPNRQLYRSLFNPSSSSSHSDADSPLDLLTKAFALSISVLPDRTSKGSLGNAHQLRIVEARKAYLCQGMLAADILAALAPGNDTALARAWTESEDGWLVSLVHLASVLSVIRPGAEVAKAGLVRGELGQDTETFKLITHRSLSIIKRLSEKAGKGVMSRAFVNGVNGSAREEDEDGDEEGRGGEVKAAPKWEGIPHVQTVMGAALMANTEKVALGQLLELHYMAMQ